MKNKPASKWKLQDFENEVTRLDPQIKQSSNEFQCGVMLLSALKVGTKVNDLVKFTGYPRGFVMDRAKRCRENGIFKQGEVHCDWFHKDEGGVAFWMDVLVAEGLMARK